MTTTNLALPPGPDLNRALTSQRLALQAMEQAFQRLERERHDVFAAYAPAGESLFWAVACHEGFELLLGRQPYMSFVANDQDGQLMEGIAWARNRMGHQRAVVLDKHYGTELGTWVLGLGVLGTRDHLKWAPVSAIPAGISNRGREIYVRRMAGQPVSDAIDAARRWVKTMGPVCGL